MAAQLDADEAEYYHISGQILEGSYRAHPRRVIGFPVVLAGMQAVVGSSYMRVQALVTCLFGMTAPLLYLLVRRELGSEWAARLAGLLAACWPPFVWYGGTLYSEALALPLLVVLLLVTPPRDPVGPPGRLPWGRWLAAGVILGLCMHNRPMYLLYAPIAAARALWNGGRPRRGVVALGLLTAGCLAVVLPWSVHQTLRFGKPILLCDQGGETLAGGLNPRMLKLAGQEPSYIRTAEGREAPLVAGKWFGPAETGYLSIDELRLPYAVQSDLLTRRTVAWVRAHPDGALKLSALKLLYMWGIYPFWNGRMQTFLGNIPTAVLLVLGTAGLVRLRRFGPELASFWTLILFSSGAALVSWGSWRFRQPGDLGVIALAAALPFASDITRTLAGRRVDLPPKAATPSPSPTCEFAAKDFVQKKGW
jgi:4-amino-4-deoxy-L-arabinose transferase-like glycosyltransferase